MPFHDGVYYPYSSETPGPHSSAGIPSLLSSPLSQPSPPVMTSAFKFRPRRESVDWRRINAVDVDLVVSQLDVDALQDHISAVTFCSLEGERCHRCQSPIDPALVKLLRLAQLMMEWLLYCQEFLSLNLRVSEERLAAASREHEQLLAQLKQQEEKAKALTAELKQRKKVIRTQQSLLTSRISSSQKCLHCEKSFLNSSFLQNHLQRRHPDEYQSQLQSDTESKSQIAVLKMEINSLKQQIVQQQQALDTKIAQEREQQSLHKELLKELERFKAEEIARMDRKIEDSRDGIRREMTILYNQNMQAFSEVNHNQPAKPEKPISCVNSQAERDVEEIQLHAIQKLEQQLAKQDKKWESKLQDIKAQHESEKNQLLNKLSRMQSSVEHNEQLQQDMTRSLLEKEQTIKAQREQIKTISSSFSSKVIELPVSVAAPDQKQKRVILEESASAPQLDPIQELSEEDKDSSISEKRPAATKHDISPAKKQKVSSNALKKNPNIKREMRPELEQSVIKKLESLGVKPEQKRLKNKELNSLLVKVQSKREAAAKKASDFWHCREVIESMVEQKLDSQRKHNGAPSEAQTVHKKTVQVMQIRPRSSSLPSRSTESTSGVKRSKTPQAAPRTKPTLQSKTSAHNTKSDLSGVTSNTPPFSSGEESEYEESDTDEPERKSGRSLRPGQSAVKGGQVRVSRSGPVRIKQAAANQSFSSRTQHQESAGTTSRTAVLKVEGEEEEDELQEVNSRPFQGFKHQNANAEKKRNHKDTKINDLARKMEKQFSERSVKRPAGGVSVIPERNSQVQELTLTDLEEGSDLLSSLEHRPEASRLEFSRSSELLRKSLDSSSTSVWGTSTKKEEKSGGTEAGMGSTLMSSICSVSDFSDSEDSSDKQP